MSEDRHIHIHIHGADGASESVAATPEPVKRASKPSAPPSPPKKKRKVGEYHQRVGKEISRLRRAHPRMAHNRIMKKAHTTVKRSTWYKKRK